GVRAPVTKSVKTLAVREIERNVAKVLCWDIQTEKHHVYLPEHDVTVSQCDDITVLIVAMLLSAAIPARIIKQAWTGAAQEHVLAGGQLENGDWLRMDGSTRKPLGSSHVADDEVWIDPMEPLGAIPDAKAEIIIVAGPFARGGGGGGGHGGGGHAAPHGGGGGGHPHGGGGGS